MEGAPSSQPRPLSDNRSPQANSWIFVLCVCGECVRLSHTSQCVCVCVMIIRVRENIKVKSAWI